MLIGADGKPLTNTAKIIGAPKIQDFDPMTEVELRNIIVPLQQALDHGANMNTPASLPTFVLARLIRTIYAMGDNVMLTAKLLKHCIDSADIEFDEEQKKILADLLPGYAEQGNESSDKEQD
jgi:hypothetical protein